MTIEEWKLKGLWGQPRLKGLWSARYGQMAKARNGPVDWMRLIAPVKLLGSIAPSPIKPKYVCWRLSRLFWYKKDFLEDKS